MPARVSLVLSSFIYWVAVASAFTFTSSFDGWVGNSTHTLTWDVSNSDPTSYDLAIAHSNNVNVPGVILDGTLSMDWSMKIAIQIPSNGNHFLTFTLPPEVLPGFYYMVMQNGTSTPLTPTFLISSSASAASNSSMSVIPTPLSTLAPSAGTTTFESYVQVTATQSALATQNGRVITVKPSDVFSSAVVYTTIIVAGGEGKGTPPEKIQLIVGLVLGIVFLLTIPIVVWLILRYRRRPTNSGSGDDNLDKRPSPLDAENLVNSSTLDLLEPNTAVANPVSNSSPTSTEPIRHVWAIVDGQKRATAVPRYPTSAPSTSNPNPFADPVHLNAPRPQQLPRLAIPSNPAQSSSLPPTTTTSNGTILSGVNTSRASPSPMYSRNETSEASHLAPSLSAPHIQEKTVQARRQRPNPPRVLSPDEVSARIFVPGRAVDMGPLGRTRAGDVDENGLLPPDYSQATQPILPSHAT